MINSRDTGRDVCIWTSRGFEEGISDGKREKGSRSLEGRRNHVGIGLLLLLHELLTGNLEGDGEADLGRLL